MNSKRRAATTIVAGLAACLSAPVQAAETDRVILKPASPWQLDMADNKCRIARLFGSADNPDLFLLEQWAPSSLADWRAAGPSLAEFSLPGGISYSFGAAGDKGQFDAADASLGEYGKVVGGKSPLIPSEEPIFNVELGRPSEEARDAREADSAREERTVPGSLGLDSDAAASVTSLELSQDDLAPVVFELGSMKAPMAAMNTCMDDLVRHWGLDVAEQKSVAVPAKLSNIAAIARQVQRIYPRKALVKGSQANFVIRTIISASGEIEECTLLNTTVADGFDAKKNACTVIQSMGKAEPAKTAEDKPIKSYIVTGLMYRIPG